MSNSTIRQYRLTAGDQKKITTRSEAEYKAALEAFDSKKESLGRRFGLCKRDFASRLLRQTEQYFLGKGAGALDLAEGRPYGAATDTTESFQNAWNLGYYTGYTSRSNLKDMIAHNPNFAHLQK